MPTSLMMDAFEAACILMDLVNHKDWILKEKPSGTFKTALKRVIKLRGPELTIKIGKQVYHGSHCLNWLTDDNKAILKEWFNDGSWPQKDANLPRR